MSLPRSTRKHIEAQNFEAVEDDWLTRLGEDPPDLEFFSATARALAASGGPDTARELLELLHEQLVANSSWEQRLELLESTGEISYSPQALHGEVISTLSSVYSRSDVVETLVEKLGLDKPAKEASDLWKKVRRLRGVLAYDVGAVVVMAGKGAGRVVEVNVALDKLKVDFENHPGLSIGFGAAAKVLDPLPEDHFLRRKLDQREELVALAKSDPPEALRQLLTSQPKQTATQIKASMSGLIADKSWSSWWTRARNHPQLVATGKGTRQIYSWAESAAAAGEEVRVQFDRADLTQKLEIFLREAKRNPEAAIDLGNQLTETADEFRSGQPADAIRIVAALDRSGLDLEQPSFSTDDILRSSGEVPGILRALSDRSLRLACLQRLPELRDDWTRVYANAVANESDAPVIDFLLDKLWGADRELADELINRILSEPGKRPEAFLRLMQSLETAPYFGDRNPARALGQLLRAKSLPEFSKLKNAVQKILEDGSATHALIQKLESDQAEGVQELFERTSLEEFLRDRLLTALHMRFPDLSTSVSDSLYSTVGVIEQKRIELRKLLEVEIPANRKAIEEARELGDLRENFEYKSARQRHEYLSARVTNLERDLTRAKPIAFDQIDSSEVRVGATVTLASTDDDGSEREITILGPWDSNPDLGILSYESDAGALLLGKRPGDVVELGRDTWRVRSIRPYGDG